MVYEITHGPGIDEPISLRETQTGTNHYFNQDALGSVWSATDSSGSVDNSYKYSSYGEPLDAGVLSYESQFAYTGRELDVETGFYYNRNRYYISGMGRFNRPDPLGIIEDNIYAYALNNPVSWIDPYGLAYMVKDPNQPTVRPPWIPILPSNPSWFDYIKHPFKILWAEFTNNPAFDLMPTALATGPIKGVKNVSKMCKVTRFVDDAEALIDLAKQGKRIGLTQKEAKILMDWASEYGINFLDHIETTHWLGGPHIRIGPINHIPVH